MREFALLHSPIEITVVILSNAVRSFSTLHPHQRVIARALPQQQVPARQEILARQTAVQLGDLHALYGFSAIVAVMIMYGYRTSPFLKGKELLLYGLGSVFVMGLGIRNLFLH